ncbi:MAG TPA: hypothetical protein VHM19_22220 [Polyangiales bacterium]|jgi:DNA-binding NtrC family response regulator|nr:hypothetical protein [Polyangiales bacterium]
MSTDATTERRTPLFALIADGDDLQRQRLETELNRLGAQVSTAQSLADARSCLHPELSILIVSTSLSGAGAVPQLLRAARRVAPLVECVVVRDPSEPAPRANSVRDLTRPLDVSALAVCVTAADETRAAMRSVTTLLVGRIGLKEAQRVLRAGMSRAALARCAGSRRAAAALLGVDRRYVQKLCAEREAVESYLSKSFAFTPAANGTTG